MKKGFISINRSIREHWIYDDPIYLKAWLALLMMANFKEGKLVLGKNMYKVKRGQTSMSLRSWAYELNISVKRVTTIFDLFESDGMIKREILGIGKQSTTLITIENYDDYQIFVETQEKREGNIRETQGKHEGNAKGIQYNKGNKDNKGNNNINISESEFLEYGETLCIELKKDFSRYQFGIKSKFVLWSDNDWIDGKGNQIKNWKTKLRNSMKYIEPTEPKQKPGFQPRIAL